MDPDALWDGEWGRSMGAFDRGDDRRRGDSSGVELGASHCN